MEDTCSVLTVMRVGRLIKELKTTLGIKKLYPPQKEAIGRIDQDNSVLMAVPTSAGKTLVGYYSLIKNVKEGKKGFYIVPLRALAWEKLNELREIAKEMMPFCRIGVTVGDYDKIKGLGKYDIIVATSERMDSLLRQNPKWLTDVGTIIVDEVHMAKADVLKRLLTGAFANAGIRWGLTGTVPKEDYEFYGIKCSLGDVTHRIPAKELQDKGVLAKCHVNVLQTQDHPMFKSYPEELKWLTTDDTRMTWVAQTINDIANSGNTLILVDRISAGELLKKKIKDSVFISGSTKTLDRKEHYDEVSVAKSKIIIATYGVASVGINIPRIFNLVLIEPGKSFVRVIQSIGRGIRKAEDKDHVQIWDITSSCKFAKRHLTQRKKFYKEANYPYTIEKIDYENPYVRK